MRTALALLLGRSIPRAEFQGTAGEQAIYERAVNIWRAAGYAIRSQRGIAPTLGARVSRSRGWTKRAAAILLPIAILNAACGTSPTEPTEARTKVVGNTNCPLEQKDMYGFCIPPQPPTPTPTPAPTVPR